MKNIGASASAVLTHEKKEKVEEVVEEEYHQMENEMIFYLNEAPEYQISAVAERAENSRGDIVIGADTYFRHILTGQRCGSAWLCLVDVPEYDEHSTEMWETLCMRIEKYENLKQTICDEKRVGV